MLILAAANGLTSFVFFANGLALFCPPRRAGKEDDEPSADADASAEELDHEPPPELSADADASFALGANRTVRARATPLGATSVVAARYVLRRLADRRAFPRRRANCTGAARGDRGVPRSALRRLPSTLGSRVARSSRKQRSRSKSRAIGRSSESRRKHEERMCSTSGCMV